MQSAIYLSLAVAYFALAGILLLITRQTGRHFQRAAIWLDFIIVIYGIKFLLEVLVGYVWQWHLFIALVTWYLVQILWKHRVAIHHFFRQSELLGTAWEHGQDGKMVFEVVGNDLRLLQQNPAAKSLMHPYAIQEGDLMCEKLPLHQTTLTSDNRMLIEAYLDVHRTGKVLRETLKVTEALPGWWSVTIVPIPKNLLLLSFRDVTEETENRRKLATAAVIEPLTGLFNIGIYKQLPFPVHGCIYLALDYFKQINELRGHATGDIVIQVIADRLKRLCHLAIRSTSGDQFVLLFETNNLSELSDLAIAVLESVRQPIEVGKGGACLLSASIGISSTAIEGVSTLDNLIHSAEIAMRIAKTRRNDPDARIECWNSELALAEQRKTDISFQLMQTLLSGNRCNELHLVYQPIVNLATGEIIGAEALARWKSLVLGDISPSEFIPIADTRGLTHLIGRIVINLGLKQLSQWQKLYPNFLLTVNVNPSELVQQDFLLLLKTALKDAAVDPATFALEITERELADDFGRYWTRLQDVSDLRVQLKIDDFGKERARFDELTRDLFDGLKLDMQFVPHSEQDEKRIAVCASVITLAQRLGISLVCEGIETQLQAQILINLGCKGGQGYYFSRPLPVQEMEQLIKDRATLPLIRPEF